jgi:hypothetical protein
LKLFQPRAGFPKCANAVQQSKLLDAVEIVFERRQALCVILLVQFISNEVAVDCFAIRSVHNDLRGPAVRAVDRRASRSFRENMNVRLASSAEMANDLSVAQVQTPLDNLREAMRTKVLMDVLLGCHRLCRCCRQALRMARYG